MSKKHVFEIAELGKAPFKFIGVEKVTYQACPGAPIQPGGACDYCGTGISIWCWIEDSEGKRFKVGSECVNKVSSDKAFREDAKYAIARYRTQERNQKEHQRIQRGRELVSDLAATLRHMPHSQPWAREKGMTKLDEIQWWFSNAGHKGMLDTTKWLEKLVTVRVGK